MRITFYFVLFFFVSILTMSSTKKKTNISLKHEHMFSNLRVFELLRFQLKKISACGVKEHFFELNSKFTFRFGTKICTKLNLNFLAYHCCIFLVYKLNFVCLEFGFLFLTLFFWVENKQTGLRKLFT